MAYSHDGKRELAEKIVTDAAQAGANAISIHITHMPSYMSKNYGNGPGRVSAGKETQSIYDYLSDISLPFEDWQVVAETAGKCGLDLIIMPNDTTSLQFAVTLNPDAFVVPPACFEDRGFVEDIGLTGKPVYVRVGGATLGEIETVINQLSSVGNSNITLLYGHQNYPTDVGDTNLMFIECLKESFGYPVGIADHVDADDEFATIVPLLAVPLGISCIEKHITHDRSCRGEDFESALNGHEFSQLVSRVRKAEQAIGNRYMKPLDASSVKYRDTVRKKLVAARHIKVGEVITAESIAAKRSDVGLSPEFKPFFIGKVASVDIDPDAGITWSCI